MHLPANWSAAANEGVRLGLAIIRRARENVRECVRRGSATNGKRRRAVCMGTSEGDIRALPSYSCGMWRHLTTQ